jgi:hypothetical protein
LPDSAAKAKFLLSAHGYIVAKRSGFGKSAAGNEGQQRQKATMRKHGGFFISPRMALRKDVSGL